MKRLLYWGVLAFFAVFLIFITIQSAMGTWQIEEGQTLELPPILAVSNGSILKSSGFNVTLQNTTSIFDVRSNATNALGYWSFMWTNLTKGTYSLTADYNRSVDGYQYGIINVVDNNKTIGLFLADILNNETNLKNLIVNMNASTRLYYAGLFLSLNDTTKDGITQINGTLTINNGTMSNRFGNLAVQSNITQLITLIQSFASNVSLNNASSARYWDNLIVQVNGTLTINNGTMGNRFSTLAVQANVTQVITLIQSFATNASLNNASFAKYIDNAFTQLNSTLTINNNTMSLPLAVLLTNNASSFRYWDNLIVQVNGTLTINNNTMGNRFDNLISLASLATINTSIRELGTNMSGSFVNLNSTLTINNQTMSLPLSVLLNNNASMSRYLDNLNATMGLRFDNLISIDALKTMNTSDNLTKLMQTVLTPERAAYIDYLSAGGGYLIDANFVDDSEYVLPTCSAAALENLNQTIRNMNQSIYEHTDLLNTTQNYATQPNVTAMISILQSINSTTGAQEGILLNVHAPSIVYTTENLTVDITLVNTTTGNVITATSFNLTIWNENDTVYLNTSDLTRRGDGSYRYSTSSIPQGTYHVTATASYGGRTTIAAANPTRISIEGNFDFSVNAADVGVMGYNIDYEVTAQVLRGQSSYETTIQCSIPEISNTSQSWNVMVFKQPPYSVIQKYMLPRNLQSKHYEVLCQLGYYNNGIPITLNATDTFLAHSRGRPIQSFIANVTINDTARYALYIFLAVGFLVAAVKIRNYKPKKKGDDAE